jgi:predicted DNA repair protein MutK
MFLVGGGILVHGIGLLEHYIEGHAGGPLGWLVSSAFNAVVGIVAGAIVLAIITAIGKLRRRPDRAGAMSS